MNGVPDTMRARNPAYSVGTTRLRCEINDPPARTGIRLAFMCVCAVLWLLVSMNAGVAQDPDLDQPVVSVRIEGNTTIPAEAILPKIKMPIDRPMSPDTLSDQIREDVKQLYATRWFFSVEPVFSQGDGGLIVTFRVQERPMVRNVVYNGNKKIKTKQLAEWTGLRPGSPFDVDANLESARRIEMRYKERGHTWAKVTLQKGGESADRDVVFEIYEGPKPKVVRRIFEGNRDISSAILRRELQTKSAILGLLGGKFDPESIHDDIASLTQYYRGLGYFDATVEGGPRISRDRSQVVMAYKVVEGPRYRIRKLNVVGNRVIPLPQIKRDFEVKAGDHFNARFVNQDVANMRQQYGELGRLNASVEAVPTFLEEQGVVDLTYHIDEDRILYVRQVNVQFDGDVPHTRETTVLDRMVVHPGDLADQRLIRKSQLRLQSSQVFDSGPQGVRINVKPVEEFGVPGSTSIVRGQPDTMPAATTRQPDRVTRPVNETGIRPASNSSGQRGVARPPFTTNQADDAVLWPPLSQSTSTSTRTTDTVRDAPVYALTNETTVFRAQNFDGPFRTPENPVFDNSPQGNPLAGSVREPPPGYIDLDVYATEGRTGRLMFGVGVNSDAGVVGSIVIDESNFDIMRPPTSWRDIIDGKAWRGAGQRFRLEAVPGNQVSRYLASWTDPYFMHSDYSLSLSGFFFNRFYEDWSEQRLGGRIAIGRQLSPDWSVTGAIRLEDVEVSNPRSSAPLPALLADVLGNNFLSTGRVSVANDTRDSTVTPSEGHFAELSYEQAFGDFDYARIESEFRQYFTTWSRPDGTGKQVLSVGGNVGWSANDTPIFERFFAGGFQTFRGFAFRGVTPVSPAGNNNGIGIGGNFMAIGTAEYRVPLTADDMIQAVVFSDFGTVDTTTTFDDFRVTVGAGLRVVVPAMGPVPLAFDFGFPVVKQDFDDPRVFSFYVGINR